MYMNDERDYKGGAKGARARAGAGHAAVPGRRRVLASLSSLALVGVLPAAIRGAHAADPFPTRPIKVIVAFAPGSQTDALVRTLSPRMGQALGTTIVVDNKPGATGIIGTQFAANAPPDGYTLVMGGVSSHGTLPAVNPKLPYDALKDFVPIGLATAPPAFIAVHPSVPANNLKEFVEWSKQQPAGVSYASTGVGSSGHLSAEMLAMQTGAKLVQIPYKDVGQATTDLLSGQVKMFIYYTPLLPHIRAGRLKALAVLADKRVDAAPEIATAAEQGFPRLIASGWTGLFGPAGLPDAIRDQVANALAQALADPEVKAVLAQQGQQPNPLGPVAFRAFVEADIGRWKEVVRVAGVKME